MANNANINKVIYGNDTLIDLTGDTVTQADVLSSKTFHDASGTLRTGSLNINDKVGWTDNTLLGAKNILPQYIYVGTKTANGVTFTADSEGIVTCSGTSSAVTTWRVFITLKAGSYKIYGGENIGTKAGSNVFVALYNSTTTHYYEPDTGTDDTYTFTNDTEVGYTLRIGNGVDSSSYVFKPMLYYASDTDATFAPYTKTNRELTTNSVTWNDAEKSVKKNLIPFPYAEGTQGSRTTRGVSFFLDNDGTIRTSGTCTNSNGATFYLWQNGIPDWLESGVDYVLTGCPSGGSTSTYMIQYNNWTEGESYQVHDVGNGVLLRKITDSTTQKLRIWINNGVNANGLVFKPMIRKATVLDTNYERGIPDNTEVMTWKANTKLGAKNRNKSESSFVFVKSTARYKSFYMDDVSATDEQNFRVSFDYSAISGYSGSTTALYVRFGNGTGNASDAQVTLAATSGHFEKILPCPANTNNLYCFIPSTEADNATITISNVMIYSAEDTDDTYVPYVMTNKELTDKTPLMAIYGTTTYAEINSAFEAGRVINVKRDIGNDLYFGYTLADKLADGTFYFRTFGNSNTTNYYCYINSSGTWGVGSTYLAPLASPAFTGTPTAPTATAGTNTTQIATTAFVQTAIDNAVTSALSASY